MPYSHAIPFLIFLELPHSKNLELSCCLWVFHLHIALNLPKYTFFIHTAHMPFQSKICLGQVTAFYTTKQIPTKNLFAPQMFSLICFNNYINSNCNNSFLYSILATLHSYYIIFLSFFSF